MIRHVSLGCSPTPYPCCRAPVLAYFTTSDLYCFHRSQQDCPPTAVTSFCSPDVSITAVADALDNYYTTISNLSLLQFSNLILWSRKLISEFSPIITKKCCHYYHQYFTFNLELSPFLTDTPTQSIPY